MGEPWEKEKSSFKVSSIKAEATHIFNKASIVRKRCATIVAQFKYEICD